MLTDPAPAGRCDRYGPGGGEHFSLSLHLPAQFLGGAQFVRGQP